MKACTQCLFSMMVLPFALLAVDRPSDQFQDMRVVVRTPLIQEYLPNHEVVALPLHRTGKNNIIVTDKASGTSVHFGEDWRATPTEATKEKFYRVPEVSKLLAALDIRVPDGKSAIKLAKLIEDLTRSPMEIYAAMMNKKDFTLFETRGYTSRKAKRKHWLYTVEKENGFWVVIVTHGGPPATMITVPPIYEIETGPESRFVEIRKRMHRDRPARK